MDRRLVRQVLIVSALAASAVLALRAGLDRGIAPLVGAGVLLCVLALAGVLMLARTIVVSERRRAR